MPKPCSLELRGRVVDAVESGASRREAADWFEVSPSSAIKWMQRRQATGSISVIRGLGFGGNGGSPGWHYQ
jgi:transposase